MNSKAQVSNLFILAHSSYFSVSDLLKVNSFSTKNTIKKLVHIHERARNELGMRVAHD